MPEPESVRVEIDCRSYVGHAKGWVLFLALDVWGCRSAHRTPRVLVRLKADTTDPPCVTVGNFSVGAILLSRSGAVGSLRTA
jgi:hypothetical protein